MTFVIGIATSLDHRERWRRGREYLYLDRRYSEAVAEAASHKTAADTHKSTLDESLAKHKALESELASAKAASANELQEAKEQYKHMETELADVKRALDKCPLALRNRTDATSALQQTREELVIN